MAKTRKKVKPNKAKAAQGETINKTKKNFKPTQQDLDFDSVAKDQDSVGFTLSMLTALYKSVDKESAEPLMFFIKKRSFIKNKMVKYSVLLFIKVLITLVSKKAGVKVKTAVTKKAGLTDEVLARIRKSLNITRVLKDNKGGPQSALEAEYGPTPMHVYMKCLADDKNQKELNHSKAIIALESKLYGSKSSSGILAAVEDADKIKPYGIQDSDIWDLKIISMVLNGEEIPPSPKKPEVKQKKSPLKVDAPVEETG